MMLVLENNSCAGIVSVALLVLSPGIGRAGDPAVGFEPPRVSYRADIRIAAGKLALIGTVHYAPGKERRDLGFEGTSFRGKPIIYRRDKGLVWVLNAPRKTYFSRKMPKIAVDGKPALAIFLAEKVKIGPEKIDGLDTVKYRVVYPKGTNGQISGHAWVTPDNVMVRMIGKVTLKERTRPYSIMLSNLRVGPVPDEVFELPADYRPGLPTPYDLGIRRPSVPAPPRGHPGTR